MTQPVDRNILLEIVRVVGTRSKVPERVRVRGNEFQLTYLDDHKHRLEDALMRHDADRINMLYGQLASKVKYQMLRHTAARRPGTAAKKRGTEKQRAQRRPTAASRRSTPAASKRKDTKRKAQNAKKRRAAAPKKARAAKKTVGSRAARR